MSHENNRTDYLLRCVKRIRTGLTPISGEFFIDFPVSLFCHCSITNKLIYRDCTISTTTDLLINHFQFRTSSLVSLESTDQAFHLPLV